MTFADGHVDVGGLLAAVSLVGAAGVLRGVWSFWGIIGLMRGCVLAVSGLGRVSVSLVASVSFLRRVGLVASVSFLRRVGLVGVSFLRRVGLVGIGLVASVSLVASIGLVGTSTTVLLCISETSSHILSHIITTIWGLDVPVAIRIRLLIIFFACMIINTRFLFFPLIGY